MAQELHLLNTIIFKYVYWYMKQISGERLQDHWSSGSIMCINLKVHDVCNCNNLNKFMYCYSVGAGNETIQDHKIQICLCHY